MFQLLPMRKQRLTCEGDFRNKHGEQTRWPSWPGPTHVPPQPRGVSVSTSKRRECSVTWPLPSPPHSPDSHPACPARTEKVSQTREHGGSLPHPPTFPPLRRPGGRLGSGWQSVSLPGDWTAVVQVSLVPGMFSLFSSSGKVLFT